MIGTWRTLRGAYKLWWVDECTVPLYIWCICYALICVAYLCMAFNRMNGK